MYRLFTWSVLQAGVDPENEEGVKSLLAATRFELASKEGELFLLANGESGGAALSQSAINSAVSHIAKIPEVREVLVAWQRRCSETRDIVMEGRDIASVVFPNADHKFYLDASPEERLRRRAREGNSDAVAERDRIDSQRRHSPLVVAEGAEVIDTTALSITQVVEVILESLAQRGLASHPRA